MGKRYFLLFNVFEAIAWILIGLIIKTWSRILNLKGQRDRGTGHSHFSIQQLLKGRELQGWTTISSLLIFLSLSNCITFYFKLPSAEIRGICHQCLALFFLQNGLISYSQVALKSQIFRWLFSSLVNARIKGVWWHCLASKANSVAGSVSLIIRKALILRSQTIYYHMRAVLCYDISSNPKINCLNCEKFCNL